MRHVLHLLAFSIASTPQAPPVQMTPQAPAVQSELSARSVPTTKTFRNGSYHAGHDCPNCGYERQRTPITGWVGRQHQHNCPHCPTWWIH